ncbi:hypothetical protein Tco_1554638 [Tanacetum coccineum]
MYAMTCTRPDFSFALNMVSRHQQNPGEGYWIAVKNILKCTKDRFLVYGGEEELISGDMEKFKARYSGRITCESEYIAAFPLTKEPKDHGKSKHIERKYHFVRRKVGEGHVIVKHIRSEDNLAYPFTKALVKSSHDEHARSIGLQET